MGLRALHTAKTALPSVKKQAMETARDHRDRALALAKDDGGTRILAARFLEDQGHDDEGRAEAARAFARFSDGVADRNAAFVAATNELGLIDGSAEPDGMPWSDGFTVRALCNAALDAGTSQAPTLKNGCAWLLLRAREEEVRDPARALDLAREAWEESNKKIGAITHTWACALAQNGQPEEGLALLELLAVDGESGLPASFLAAERKRLALLVSQEAKDTPPAVVNVPPAVEVR